MKKLLFPFAALIVCSLFMSFMHFPKDQNRLVWEESVKLTWDDFQGTPDEASAIKAATFSSVEYNYKAQKEVIQVEVVTYFDRGRSWISKEKTARTPAQLKHEQLHFNMTELMARKIRKDISSYISKEIPTTQAYIDKANATYKAELDSLSEVYDTETNHGAADSKQKKWETKINSELKKLDAFSATKVEIKRSK